VDISQELKRIRLEKGVTLEESASHIGITRQYLSMLEKGERRAVSFEIMVRVSEYYQVPLDYFGGVISGSDKPLPFGKLNQWHTYNKIVKDNALTGKLQLDEVEV
jgi:transcriptional regulator with XRE-family HTH domain